jgi:hypothetical protein
VTYQGETCCSYWDDPKKTKAPCVFIACQSTCVSEYEIKRMECFEVEEGQAPSKDYGKEVEEHGI